MCEHCVEVMHICYTWVVHAATLWAASLLYH